MKMIRWVFVTVYTFASLCSIAQNAYEQKKSYSSLGYGFQLTSRKSIIDQNEKVENYKSSGFGPILLKYEYAVSGKIGLGASFSYTSAYFTWDHISGSNGIDTTYKSSLKYTKYTLTPRFNFHYGESKMMDFYTGLGIGMRRVFNKYESNDPKSINGSIKQFIPISLEISTGVRFLLTEQFGGFVEVGIGPAAFQFGAVAKF